MKNRKKLLIGGIGALAAVVAGGAITAAVVLGKRVEVSFALPKQYEAFSEEITLPETTKVKSGTAVGELSSAGADMYVFNGWYYDEELSRKAGDGDEISEDLTLYPAFDKRLGLDTEFSTDYISSLDVSGDFSVTIAAYGFTRENTEAYLAVKNITRGGEEVAYTLKEITPEEALSKEEAGAGDAALSEDAAGEEALYDYKELEADTSDVSEALLLRGIDPETVTEEELRTLYMLSDGESVLRYLREDMALDVESTLALQEMLEENEKKKTAVYYRITAASGSWDEGTTYQIELSDTEHLRFVYDGEAESDKITYYNFTVPQEEVNNLVLNDMLFIPLDEVLGVELSSGLYSVTEEDGEASAETRQTSGIMAYSGELSAGQTVAVYDGTVNDDGTVDGDVTYLNITEVVSENEYAYETAGFTDVIFMPDIIPLQDDGSFGDLTITVAEEELDFSGEVYEELGLDETTVVEAGDYIAFYEGDLNDEFSLESAGYGLITKVSAREDGSLVLHYEEVTKEKLMDAFEMYSKVDNVDIPVTEEMVSALEKNAEEQLLSSGFADETRDYMMALLTGEEYDIETSEFSEELKELTFCTETGEEISLEELRLLAGDSKKCKISDGPSISFAISPTLQHYDGKGIRLEATVGFTIEIELNSTGGKQNKLEIKLYCALEQEVVLGLDVKTSSEWKWYAFIPVIKEVHLTASFRAGTYTGFGASATVTTGSDNDSEDEEWKDLISLNNKATVKEAEGLIKMGEKLEGIDKSLKTIQNGGNYSKSKGEEGEFKNGDDDDGAQYQGVGGSLEEKYSSMLENDAEYINLLNVEVFKIAASPDPFHLIEFSLEADLVVSLKVNAMIGFGVSYGNAKQYCFNVDVFAGNKTTSSADLETPNFRADAYAFGMIGLRAGVLFDARVGLISTEMDSIGITAEAGFYAEAYGFLYMSYTWESGKGTNMSAMGSLYFEMGTYLEINFVAQIGKEKLSKDAEIYSNTWPLLKLGAEAVPLDFEIEEDDEKLTVEITAGKNTVKLPDELYNINMMAMTSGEVEAESQDSAETGSEAYSFTVRGRTYTQYNEENFTVTCYDLEGGKDGKLTENHSFQYIPATNEVYVKPVDQEATELWGVITFTYRNTTFGFNTETLSREVYVHWEGKAQSAEVEYYVKNAEGTYELQKTGEFSGFDGIQYDLVVDEAFCSQMEGYRLVNAEFVEEEQMREVFDKYLAAYEEASKLYRRQSLTQAEYDKATADYNLAYETYNNYGLNIVNTIKNQEGTLYFLMTSPETTVKLYFDPVVNSAAWMINPGKAEVTTNEGEAYTAYTIDRMASETVLQGTCIMDSMPDSVKTYMEEHGDHEFTWYYYLCENTYENLREAVDNESAWIELTEDTEMPDHAVCVIGIEENRGEYTLSWCDGEEIIDSQTVQAGEAIPEHAGPENVTEGKYFIYWSYPEKDIYCMVDTMPEGNLTLYPVYGYENYDVTLCYEGISAESFVLHTSMKFETPLYDGLTALSDWVTEPGMELVWYLQTEEGEVEIDEGMTMPAGDITVTGRYEYIPHTVTFIDGTEMTEESYRFGETVALPEKEDEDDLSLGWLYEGEYVLSAFTMPHHDCTLTANWHVHDWNVLYEQSGNCQNEGMQIVQCKECALQTRQLTEKDPDVHCCGMYVGEYTLATCVEDGNSGNWYCMGCDALLKEGESIPANGSHELEKGELLQEATCLHGEIYEYSCKNCDYTEEKETGDPDPENHGSLKEKVDAKEATCTEEGYTGDTVCEDCDEIIEKGTVIEKTAHKTKLVDAKEATCTEEGYSGDKVCEVCGETIEKGSITPKADHKTKIVNAKEATATTEGYTGDKVCEICGETIEKGETIGKLAETYTVRFVDIEGTLLTTQTYTYGVEGLSLPTTIGGKKVHSYYCDSPGGADYSSAAPSYWPPTSLTWTEPSDSPYIIYLPELAANYVVELGVEFEE